MSTILICLIYLAFVSMGLPDSLLGAAWPSIYEELGVPVSCCGIVTLLIQIGTVCSTFLSDYLTRKFKTSTITLVSTCLVAICLFGFSISQSFWVLCLWAVPYGLGGGSIDASLNNYVALHYKSRNMSWIHFFWGIGAATGPVIMSSILTGGAPWTQGYRTIGFIQTGMAVLLFLSLPLWKKGIAQTGEETSSKISFRDLLKTPGAKGALLTFFFYCSYETTAGVWASSFMTFYKGIDASTAAAWGSLFYVGLMSGRFLNGFICDRLGDQRMVRIGNGISLCGLVLMFLPFGNTCCLIGLILLGLGCAPVFPCLIHATPIRFGRENSQSFVGKQMAFAYIGSAFAPVVFGLIADAIGMWLYPVFLSCAFLGLLISSEQSYHVIKKEQHLC